MQQRFELQKAHIKNTPMTDLEDLFDGALTLEAQLVNSSSNQNLMPKDDMLGSSNTQQINVRAIKTTKKYMQFGYIKMDASDEDLIDELEDK